MKKKKVENITFTSIYAAVAVDVRNWTESMKVLDL